MPAADIGTDTVTAPAAGTAAAPAAGTAAAPAVGTAAAPAAGTAAASAADTAAASAAGTAAALQTAELVFGAPVPHDYGNLAAPMRSIHKTRLTVPK